MGDIRAAVNRFQNLKIMMQGWFQPGMWFKQKHQNIKVRILITQDKFLHGRGWGGRLKHYRNDKIIWWKLWAFYVHEVEHYMINIYIEIVSTFFVHLVFSSKALTIFFLWRHGHTLTSRVLTINRLKKNLEMYFILPQFNNYRESGRSES